MKRTKFECFTPVKEAIMEKKHITILCLVLGISLFLSVCRSIGPLYMDINQTLPAGTSVLHYTLKISDPHTHYLSVSIRVDKPLDSYCDIAMPAWSPGKYIIYDFAKHVRDVEAWPNGSRKKLRIRMLDKLTWRISGSAPGGFIIKYRVYANYLSGTFSQLTADSALINGASVFMYLTRARHMPIMFSVELPEGSKWRIATALPEMKEHSLYYAHNYTHLIDCPLSIGNLRTFSYQSWEKPIHIIFQSPEAGPCEQALALHCRAVCDAAGSIFGELPFPDYYFIFHFNYRPGEWDAMEHRNSTVITDTKMITNDELFMEKTILAAHELWHVWNIKCIQPCSLARFVFSKEMYTKSLWIVEGLTKYYQYVLLLRAGIISRKEFRDKLANVITLYESNPGRSVMSLEQASFLTWYDRLSQEDNNRKNTRVSYYNKGAVVGLLLDLHIRGLTKGKKGLDDVFRFMYRNYYGGKRCYTIEDFYAVCSTIAGSSLHDFFSLTAESVDELPYNEVAASCGFTLENKTTAPVRYIGVLLRETAIINIFPGSPAEKAGCQKFDEILAFGDETFYGDLETDLHNLGPGDRTTITINRNGQIRTFPLEIGKYVPVDFVFLERAIVDSDTEAVREAFYMGKDS
jgi:predicted metalloprotease with PDZ domain